MNKLKKWWNERLVKIYVIQELNNDNEVETEYYFKRERNRKLIHAQLLVLDASEHYKMWCDFREYKIGPESWKKYMESVNIIDKYILLDGKVVANDLRYKEFSYEETLKRNAKQNKNK